MIPPMHCTLEWMWGLALHLLLVVWVVCVYLLLTIQMNIVYSLTNQFYLSIWPCNDWMRLLLFHNKVGLGIEICYLGDSVRHLPFFVTYLLLMQLTRMGSVAYSYELYPESHRILKLEKYLEFISCGTFSGSIIHFKFPMLKFFFFTRNLSGLCSPFYKYET